jgi:hypothetical protein
MRATNEEARTRHAFNKLTRLMISVRDFQEALSAATFLLADVDQSAEYRLAEMRRFRCYETAMVIAYARPFSIAKGEVGPLKSKDIGYSMTVAETSLHRKLIKHRNTVYGHSDAEFVEMHIMVLHLPLDHKPTGFDWLMPRFEERMRFSLTEIDAIHEMLTKLIRALAHQGQKLGSAFKDRFTTYDIGDID